MTPATAIYLRVSTQDKGQDTAMQESVCRKFCEVKGWENIQIFKDYMSGRKSSRPRYQEMLYWVMEKKVNRVVAYKLDRLSRSAQDLLYFASVCDRYGATFSIATQPEIDTSTAVGKLLYTVLGAFAEFESNLISDRTKDGMAERKRQGVTFGGDRRSVQYQATRIKVLLFSEEGKPWSLLSVRRKLCITRQDFYRAIEWMEAQSESFITDYSDERYEVTARSFNQKRVDKEGKFFNLHDPRLVLKVSGRIEREFDKAKEFFSHLEGLGGTRVKDFVDRALRYSEQPVSMDFEIKL